jgi:hypothetical protein
MLILRIEQIYAEPVLIIYINLLDPYLPESDFSF